MLLGKKLGLKHAVISLSEIQHEADLEKIVWEEDAYVESSVCDSFSIKVKGPVPYRSVILAFDSLLKSIEGETNHVFIERLEVKKPTKPEQMATIYVITGS